LTLLTLRLLGFSRFELLESLSSVSSMPSPAASSTPSKAAAPRRLPFRLQRRTQVVGTQNVLPFAQVRPSISLGRHREWCPPVSPGVIPAYDQALAHIRSDAAAVQLGADALRLSIEKGVVPTEGVEDAKRRLDVLEVMGQVNLLEVRWKAANGMGLTVCSHSASTAA